MRRLAAILFAAVMVFGATDASARSWPGPQILRTDEPALPGAVEVLIDTPNALAWSRFQQGELGNWHYRLFPDGSATVTQIDDPRGAALRLDCRLAVACDILSGERVLKIVPATGTPRPTAPITADGEGLATFLAEWVLAGSGAPPARTAAVVQPKPSTSTASVDTDIPKHSLTAISATLSRNDYGTAPSLSFAAAGICGRNGVECAGPDRLPTPRLADWAQILHLSCSVTASASLQKASSGDVRRFADRLQTSLGCRAQLSDRLSLSVRANSYASDAQKAPWDPDITYALNFRATDRLTLTYASKGIRLDGAGGLKSALDGRLSASLTLPRVPLPAGRGADCRLRVRLPDPSRDAVSISCGLALTKRLSLGMSANFYAKGVQKPWQPDFTYSASWKLSDHFRVNYSNYAANRFPWNRDDRSKSTGWRDGTLSLSYELSF